MGIWQKFGLNSKTKAKFKVLRTSPISLTEHPIFFKSSFSMWEQASSYAVVPNFYLIRTIRELFLISAIVKIYIHKIEYTVSKNFLKIGEVTQMTKRPFDWPFGQIVFEHSYFYSGASLSYVLYVLFVNTTCEHHMLYRLEGTSGSWLAYCLYNPIPTPVWQLIDVCQRLTK